MIIRTRLTEKDFIRAFFTLIYSKFIMKLFVGIGLLYIIATTITLVTGFGNKSMNGLLTPVLFLLFFPLLLYISAKRSYSSNKRISESMEYQFEEDTLVIKGESFTTQFTWDKIYKVSQTKSLILIWQTRQMANVIPKRDIWEGDVLALKEILQKHRVKNNL